MRRVIYDVVRLLLAISFILYGGSKLLDLQFQWGYQQFDKPIRRLGGMGLVWAFFAYSRPYQICAGCAEIVPAVLLLLRRTAPLGIVIYLPVIINVVLVDLCYSVQRGATEMALLLLAGNLLLIWLERARLSAALELLTRADKDPGDDMDRIHPVLRRPLVKVLVVIALLAAIFLLDSPFFTAVPAIGLFFAFAIIPRIFRRKATPGNEAITRG